MNTTVDDGYKYIFQYALKSIKKYIPNKINNITNKLDNEYDIFCQNIKNSYLLDDINSHLKKSMETIEQIIGTHIYKHTNNRLTITITDDEYYSWANTHINKDINNYYVNIEHHKQIYLIKIDKTHPFYQMTEIEITNKINKKSFKKICPFIEGNVDTYYFTIINEQIQNIQLIYNNILSEWVQHKNNIIKIINTSTNIIQHWDQNLTHIIINYL